MARAPIPAPEDLGSSSGRDELATQERPQPLDLEVGSGYRVLVTGGDGFLGRHLIPRLVSRGNRVRAMTRKGPREGVSRIPGVEWVRADVTERGTLAGVVSGCDRIVHLAGRFDASLPFLVSALPLMAVTPPRKSGRYSGVSSMLSGR